MGVMTVDMYFIEIDERMTPADDEYSRLNDAVRDIIPSAKSLNFVRFDGDGRHCLSLSDMNMLQVELVPRIKSIRELNNVKQALLTTLRVVDNACRYAPPLAMTAKAYVADLKVMLADVDKRIDVYNGKTVDAANKVVREAHPGQM